MMSEVMRITTFFATLSMAGLVAMCVALAVAGLTNTTGGPLLCRDCELTLATKKKQPLDASLHWRRAAGIAIRAL